jgi:hypothetical protein
VTEADELAPEPPGGVSGVVALAVAPTEAESAFASLFAEQA